MEPTRQEGAEACLDGHRGRMFWNDDDHRARRRYDIGREREGGCRRETKGFDALSVTYLYLVLRDIPGLSEVSRHVVRKQSSGGTLPYCSRRPCWLQQRRWPWWARPSLRHREWAWRTSECRRRERAWPAGQQSGASSGDGRQCGAGSRGSRRETGRACQTCWRW